MIVSYCWDELMIKYCLLCHRKGKMLMCSYFKKSWDLASISSTPSPSSGCKGRPANSDTTASILAWSRSLSIAHYTCMHTNRHTDKYENNEKGVHHFLTIQWFYSIYLTEMHLVRHLMSSSAAWLEVPITQSVRYSTILFLQNTMSEKFHYVQRGNTFLCK